MYITLLLDVEDIITPEADDIARDVAAILSDEGVCATFCVVGERVRQCVSRGRADVIDALARHDVGTHTDLHSVHPTIVEYLAPVPFDEGVEEALRRERPAVRAIEQVFGVTPSCWGGPGNTWGPQINEAMARLGVPAIVYAHTRVPDGDIHRYCGTLCYPAGHYAGDGDYHDDAKWERNIARLQDELRKDRDRGLQWSEVFLGHPSRILHEEFWDGQNFSLGNQPELEAYVLPRRKSDSDLERALGNLRTTVQVLRDMPGIEMRTIRQMNALAAGGETRALTHDEIELVRPAIQANVRAMAGWVILPPDTNVEPIWRQTDERLNTLERVVLTQ